MIYETVVKCTNKCGGGAGSAGWEREREETVVKYISYLKKIQGPSMSIFSAERLWWTDINYNTNFLVLLFTHFAMWLSSFFYYELGLFPWSLNLGCDLLRPAECDRSDLVPVQSLRLKSPCTLLLSLMNFCLCYEHKMKLVSWRIGKYMEWSEFTTPSGALTTNRWVLTKLAP